MKPVFAFQGLPIGLKEEKEKLYIINKKGKNNEMSL